MNISSVINSKTLVFLYSLDGIKGICFQTYCQIVVSFCSLVDFFENNVSVEYGGCSFGFHEQTWTSC